MHLPDMLAQIAHAKVLPTMHARLSNLFVKLFDMSGKVVHTYFFFTIRTLGLLAKVDALNMIKQPSFHFKPFHTVGTLKFTNYLIDIFSMAQAHA